MLEKTTDIFPLSKQREIKGNRRLVREKILQVLVAFELSGTDLDFLYNNIFFRDFSFDSLATVDGKLLKPDEIFELEADIPIKWQQDDIEFSRIILNGCIELKGYIESIIENEVKNWDIERLALIDKTLILMAATELLRCNTIPTKVTINEIIDIAKNFSTDKSHLFINGILDSFLAKFISENLIHKTGKGLIDHS